MAVRANKVANKGIVGGVYWSSWKDQVYSTSFHVLISPTMSLKPCFEFLAATRPAWDYDPQKDNAAAMCSELQGSVYGHEIFLMFQCNAPVGAMVHELIHAKSFVFMYHGVRLDPENDEHEAYYMTYLMNKCLEAYEEREQLIKKKKNGRKA